MEVTRAQALNWRLGRQFLLAGARTVEQVVGRLGALPAWSGDPELAVGRRLARRGPDEVERALRDGRLMRTYAFRGATHLMRPEDAGRYLALRAAGRMWERSSWVRHYGLAPEDWPALRAVVRGVVADGPVGRAELGDGVRGHGRFAHVADAFSDGSDTFLKPFAWQGDLCLAPDRDGRAMFQSPTGNPRWAGIPDLEVAGRDAVVAYLDAYGPATPEHLQYWLGEGLGAGRARIERWRGEVADDLVEVEVDGTPMLHVRAYLEALTDQEPSATLVLLPGHDQWVLGPGTADQRIVPTRHRAEVSRGANLVVLDGRVAGTWRVREGTLTITCFPDTARPDERLLEGEVHRLGALLGRPLEPSVTAG